MHSSSHSPVQSQCNEGRKVHAGTKGHQEARRSNNGYGYIETHFIGAVQSIVILSTSYGERV